MNALRSVRLNGMNLPIRISVLTRNKHGRGEEITGREERRKNPLTFSNGLNALGSLTTVNQWAILHLSGKQS
jgi:hypothetical protein